MLELSRTPAYASLQKHVHSNNCDMRTRGYLGPYQTSMMEFFVKMINSFRLVNIFKKTFIMCVRLWLFKCCKIEQRENFSTGK